MTKISEEIREQVEFVGKILDDAIEAIQHRLAVATIAILHQKICGSPIECALLITLLARSADSSVLVEMAMDEEAAFAHAKRRATLVITPQVSIGDYCADILCTIGLGNGEVERFIVECDGHDFHDRTKEQASKDRKRDRWFQTQGYKVFRFTGSNIYGGAWACAGEVTRYAEGRINEVLKTEEP